MARLAACPPRSRAAFWVLAASTAAAASPLELEPVVVLPPAVEEALPEVDLRRSETADSFSRAFGDEAVTQELLAAYDDGKFLPKSAEEEGLEGQYLVAWRKNCEPPMWLNDADHTYLQSTRISLLKGVGADLLLSVLREPSGCLDFVEQDNIIRLPPVTEEEDSTELDDSRRLQEQPQLPWGLDFLDGQWDKKYDPLYKGNSVTVFVIDTGIDHTHPWLSGRVQGGADFTGTADTMDKMGHGTHCAGTVGGHYVGVADEVMLVPVKVLGDNGSGKLRWFVMGLDWLIMQPQRLKVASMSLGSAKATSINKAVEEVTDKGIIVVVAAGNNNGYGSQQSPCSANSAICVGALHNRYTSFGPASYSNYGCSLDIWAPGSKVYSARTTAGKGGSLGVELSGTSMACPHVAGIVAQLLSSPEFAGVTPTRETANRIKQLIRTDCQQTYGIIKKSTGAVVRTGFRDDKWQGKRVCTGFGQEFNPKTAGLVCDQTLDDGASTAGPLLLVAIVYMCFAAFGASGQPPLGY